MKKKLLISLLAAVCVLSLTACAKTPEQATESKEDTTVSQPSEVTPSDTKIEVPPEDLNPLTLEQVKNVISSMTASQDLSVGVRHIRSELNKIQEGQRETKRIPQRDMSFATYTYYLFEGNEPTNNTIVVKEYADFPAKYNYSIAGYIYYNQYDDNGQLLNEEVLYQNLDQLYDLLPMETVQEILSSSEKVENPAKQQNKFIYDELCKYQPWHGYRLVKDAKKATYDGLGYYFWVRSGKDDQLTWLVLIDPSAESNSASFQGDTTVYLEKMDMDFNTISKEIIYEAKHEA